MHNGETQGPSTPLRSGRDDSFARICGRSGLAIDRRPQRLKPLANWSFTARLKPRPFKTAWIFRTAHPFKKAWTFRTARPFCRERVLACFCALSNSIVLALALLSSSAHAAQNTEGQAPAYRIAGIVVSAKGGVHLPQTRVFLTDVKNPKNTQSVLTTDDGNFEFHVPAGKYALRGAKRGYIGANYDEHEQFTTSIVTGP